MALDGIRRDLVNTGLLLLVLSILLVFLRFGTMVPDDTVALASPVPTPAARALPDEEDPEDDVERDPSTGLILRTTVGPIGSEYTVRSVSVDLEATPPSHHYEAYIKNKGGAVSLLTMTGPLEVSRGVMTESVHKAHFTLSRENFDQLIGSRLNFTVLSTNRNGRLVIRLNDKVIWSQVTDTGEYGIDPLQFAHLLKNGENRIDVDASGSGWRVWSPTTYIISGLTLASRKGQVVTDKKRFALSRREIKGWVKGRLVFSVGQADPTGELSIAINDYIVFTGRVREKTAPPYTIDFSLPRNLLHTMNTITFSSGEGGSYHLGDIELIVFYSPKVAPEASYEFNLTSQEIYELKRDRQGLSLSLDVSQVIKRSWLTVYIMNREGSRSIIKKEAEQGTVNLPINPTYLISGHNNIQLVSNGTVYLGTLEVRMI